MEEGCKKVREEAWSNLDGESSSLREGLRGIASSLIKWSVNVVGDLEKRLKKAKKEVEKWRRASISDESVRRKAMWCFKVDKLEEQIDLYWRQQAHINWLQFGDQNTTYFHNACSMRIRG